MDVLLSVLASAAYMTVIEYAVHRWYMHRPKSTAWREHSIEHHHEGRNEDYYLCPFWRSIFFFWILGLAPLLLLSLYGPIILGVLMVWWRFSWNQIHRICHGTGSNWVLAAILCPWAWFVVQHHLKHHEKPTTNFGAIFFLTDTLMQTRYIEHD